MENLLQVISIFFTCSTILIGGFSLAATEPLKTCLSILGFIIAIGWVVCSFQLKGLWMAENVPIAKWILLFGIPLLFIVGWLISTLVHLCHWNPFGWVWMASFSDYLSPA